MYTVPDDLFHIYIVNNGDLEQMVTYQNSPYITILQQDRNLGWEGGLKAGLAASHAPYVLFMNDDTHIPSHQRLWLDKLLGHFVYSDCAAVGPTSNMVMGLQQSLILLHPEILRVSTS